jgi:hypothetical protein
LLRKESVNTTVFDLISALQEKDYLKDFVLVGGTGLALIIGHRKSVDIDLFTSKDFVTEQLLEKLESDFAYQMDYIGGNTIKGNLNGVKVDLLAHKYPLIGDVIEVENIRIASMDDLSAMKVNAIVNDGTRIKDFIDLYFLLTDHNYDVERLLSIYKTKYSHRNALHALKSLNYYEDVDLSDWPDLIKRKDTSWNEIMEAINRACEFYIGKITD